MWRTAQNVDILEENILSHSSAQFGNEPYVVVAQTEGEGEAVRKLEQDKCIEIKSLTFTKDPDIKVYLIRRTSKGKQVLHEWWDSAEHKARQKVEEKRRRAYAKKHRYDPPDKKWTFLDYGTRLLFGVKGDVVIGSSLKFDCANRAVDYCYGKLSAKDVQLAFLRANNGVEYRIGRRGGAVTVRRIS